jgi:hypothetical protein
MTSVDAEHLETTKSEKLLAVVLVAFLLVGGVWAYAQIDNDIRDWVGMPTPTAQDREAVTVHDSAEERLFLAQRRTANALSDVAERRERYRTALEAGDDAAPRLRTQYLAAERRLARARQEVRAAQREVRATAPAAAKAERRMTGVEEDERRTEERVTFLVRFALVLVSLGIGYWLLARLRHRNSRYLPLAGAALVAATILALVLSVDYLTDYWNPSELGILVLSVIGVAATVAAYWVLQRYIARRVPGRRVRRGQCPFCGFPVRGDHCEGCGRDVIAPCARCEAPRRVGTAHCAACGAP